MAISNGIVNSSFGVEASLLRSMVSHKSKILNNTFKDLTIDGVIVIDNTEWKEGKNLCETLSKTKYEKLRKELRRVSEGIWQHEKDWQWDDAKKQYVCPTPLLGEYIPNEKKVVLYWKNIEDACKNDKAPYYCRVLTTYIHELFHAVHHEAAHKDGRPYDTIREIEEAMTEFSTLVFLNGMTSDSSKWKETFDWALNTIKEKQWSLGSLPAYGFGYYLFNTLYYNMPCSDHEGYRWIEIYNQKVGAIDKKNRYVKWYQQMLNPVYPHKDEKLCLEILHSILFNI